MSTDPFFEVGTRSSNKLVELVKLMPLSVFGASLGFMGVALLPVLQNIFGFNISAFFAFFGVVFFLILVIFLCIKSALFPKILMADFKNSAVVSFSAQIVVALFLITEIAHQYHSSLDFFLYCVSSIFAALQFFLWVFVCFFRRRNYANASPSWLIPPVALLYFCVLSFTFDFFYVGLALLLLGLISLVMSLILLIKKILSNTLPASMYPGLTIFLAVPALCAMVANQVLVPNAQIMNVLFLVNLLLFFAATISFFVVIRNAFSLSWWAYTMPLCASAIAQYQYVVTVNLKLLLIAQIVSLVAFFITLIVAIKASVRLKAIVVNINFPG